MPKRKGLSKQARTAIRLASLKGNGDKTREQLRIRIEKREAKMAEQEKRTELAKTLPTTSSTSETTPELTAEMPKSAAVESLKEPKAERVPVANQRPKLPADNSTLHTPEKSPEGVEAQSKSVSYKRSQGWMDKPALEAKKALEKDKEPEEPPKRPPTLASALEELEAKRRPVPYQGPNFKPQVARWQPTDLLKQKAQEPPKPMAAKGKPPPPVAKKQQLPASKEPAPPAKKSKPAPAVKVEEEKPALLPRPAPPPYRGNATRNMQMYHEMETWKEKYKDMEEQYLQMQHKMREQAKELQSREQDSRDMTTWRQRYAHLEDYCRTIKGESMNLRKDLSDMRKELDNKDRECHELRMELHYVRNNAVRMAALPKEKKPRAPRKPREPRERAPRGRGPRERHDSMELLEPLDEPLEPREPTVRKPRAPRAPRAPKAPRGPQAPRKRQLYGYPPPMLRPISPSTIDLE